MREFIIAPEVEGKGNGKGRSFSGYLAAHITADGMWYGGEATTDNQRPVWAVVVASEAESRPLVANLRMGKKAVFVPQNTYSRSRKDRMEFLKSSKFSGLTQRFPDGVATTLYLHDLFTLDPGMVEPDGIKFILALGRDEVTRQVWDREGALAHMAAWLKAPLPKHAEAVLDLAPYFAAYLDRRSRAPWPADTRFYAMLLYTCLARGLASLDGDTSGYHNTPWGVHARFRLTTEGLDTLGFMPAVAFSASHEDFAALLAEIITSYFALVGFDSDQAGA
jgi:hypothetical protein